MQNQNYYTQSEGYEVKLPLITSIWAAGILRTHSNVSFLTLDFQAVTKELVSSHVGFWVSSTFQRNPWAESQP